MCHNMQWQRIVLQRWTGQRIIFTRRKGTGLSYISQNNHNMYFFLFHTVQPKSRLRRVAYPPKNSLNDETSLLQILVKHFPCTISTHLFSDTRQSKNGHTGWLTSFCFNNNFLFVFTQFVSAPQQPTCEMIGCLCVTLSMCPLQEIWSAVYEPVHAAELCEFFICTAVTAVCINAFKWNYRTCSYYYRWSGTWLVDNVSLLFYQPSCTKQIFIIYLIISSILFLLENNISPFIVSQLPAGCVQLWTWIREHVFCMLVKAISHVGIKSQTVSTLIFFSWLDECFQSTLWVICQNKQSFDHSWLDCCMQVHMLIHTTNQERMDQNFQSERGRLKHLEDRQKQKDVPVGGIQAGRKNEYAECAALFQFTKKYPIFL